MRNRKSQPGFTLIELIVTIALIAIFAVIAVPSYRALTADNQIIGALNDFANTLGAARPAAVAWGITLTSPAGQGDVKGFIGFNRMGFASPTFNTAPSLVIQACAKGTGHVRGGSIKLVRAGTLSTNSGGC